MKSSSIGATASVFSNPKRFALESRVRIDEGGSELIGTLQLPAGVDKPPVVIMLHGFTGHKDEFPIAASNIGLFAHTAKCLAKHGIASLRIDFFGSGESHGKWEDTTLTGQIRDACLAFDCLRNLPSVNGSRVGILGYSQGGLVGSHLAAARAEAAAVVLWAPVTNPLSTYGILMGHETVKRALLGPDESIIDAKLSWGGETKLRAAFFKELPYITPIGTIGRYFGPLRVIVGHRETVVTPQPSTGQHLLDYHIGLHDLIVVDSDHDWNASMHTKTIDDLLIPKTVEWFNSHF